jgi:hypothetical protein
VQEGVSFEICALDKGPKITIRVAKEALLLLSQRH